MNSGLKDLRISVATDLDVRNGPAREGIRAESGFSISPFDIL